MNEALRLEPAAPADVRVSTGTVLTYSFPGVGVAFLYVMMLVMYLKFATDELGLSPSMLGVIFLVSKIWDGVTDPVAGYLSDRTESRLGRRRSWILASAPLILLFSIMAWVPPLSVGETMMTVWVAVAVFGFYTAFTVFEVPHLALGAELTQRHEDRNRVFGYRQGLRSIGQLLAFTVGASIIQRAEVPTSAAAWLISLTGVATLLSIAWCVWRLPPERADYAGRGATNPLRAMRDVLSNRRARILLFVYFIEFMGVGGVGTLAPFVTQYVVGQPDLLAWVLGAYAVPATVTIPMWVWLANRYEKQNVWRAAMVIAALGFGILLFVDEGTSTLMIAGYGIAGVGHGCGLVLGQSLKADVIDCDELATGERKEGAYFAAWNFTLKLGTGLMVGLVGLSLDWAGFVPKSDQTELVRYVLVFLIGGVPLLGYAIGLGAFSRFSLTRAEHAAVREGIDQRVAAGLVGRPGADPVR